MGFPGKSGLFIGLSVLLAILNVYDAGVWVVLTVRA